MKLKLTLRDRLLDGCVVVKHATRRVLTSLRIGSSLTVVQHWISDQESLTLANHITSILQTAIKRIGKSL